MTKLILLGTLLFSTTGLLGTVAYCQRVGLWPTPLEWVVAGLAWLLGGGVVGGVFWRLVTGPSDRAAVWFTISTLLGLGFGSGFEVRARTINAPPGSPAIDADMPQSTRGGAAENSSGAGGVPADAQFRRPLAQAEPACVEFTLTWGANIAAIAITSAGAIVLLLVYTRLPRA